ncbi:hypothetical protein HK101_009203 [Irineochytrium annulatum]|nr:hypothetical protein HK101_009203 [Irineochytrium annulatum]
MLYETTPLVLGFQKAAVVIDVLLVSASCSMFGRKVVWGLHRPFIPSRCLVLLSLFMSWTFNVCATVLIIFSYGDPVACDVAILYCAALYATNRIVIYLQYLVNIGLLIPFCAVEVLMLIYRVYAIDPASQQCHVIFDSGIWSFVCLTGCMGDSTIQACLLSWVTAYSREDEGSNGDRRGTTVGITPMLTGVATKTAKSKNQVGVETMVANKLQVSLSELPTYIADTGNDEGMKV